MREAVIIACLLALGAPMFPAAADGLEAVQCPDRQYVIDYMTLKYPGVTWVIYTGVDGTSIKARLGKAKASEFIVFAKPGGGDLRVLVGLRDGCLEDSTVVPVRVLDAWLAGQEAGQ